MLRSFRIDYDFGKQSEDYLLDLIQKYFKDNIKKVKKSTEIYDYEGDRYIYELKSRTNKYDAYTTTLLGYNKIIKNNKEQIFLFSFTDGLYYIKYDESEFNNYEKKLFVRNKRTDYNDKIKLYIYIPINKLIKIEFVEYEYKTLSNCI
jgi:hypothetical protein